MIFKGKILYDDDDDSGDDDDDDLNSYFILTLS